MQPNVATRAYLSCCIIVQRGIVLGEDFADLLDAPLALDSKTLDSIPPIKTENEDGCGSATIANLNAVINTVIHNEDTLENLEAVCKLNEMRRVEEKHQWRKVYLGRSFYLAGYVLYVSLSFLLFSAVGVFTISENVLIALLTTMVANVLGVLAIAFYWLYKN